MAEHSGHVGTVLDSCVGKSAKGWGLEAGEARDKDIGGSVVLSAGDDGGVLVWRV